MKLKNLLFLFLIFLSAAENIWAAEVPEIRAGHFSTVAHAPALVARAQNSFELKLKEEARVSWIIFNAGPQAIEALFADAIDVLYVGPNPAINGFVRSGGAALRVVSGVAGGGSAFVVRKEAQIKRFEDIQGKRISTPQAGNTQDVALRHFMNEKKLKSKAQGGNVEIFNVGGGDQLTVFAKGEIDGAWTVEPWVSRLIEEADGEILFDEKELWPDGQYATALLVVRRKFLEEHPDLVQRWLEIHSETVNWMNQNQEEAKNLFNQELERETGKALPQKYLDSCFKRIVFTDDPMEYSVLESAKRAEAIGFLGRKKINLSGLFDLSLLDAVKKARG